MFMKTSTPRAATIRKVPATNLFVSQPPPHWFGNGPNEKATAWTNDNWLKSRFHFNFAEYSSGPGQFGVLRVMNDDLVQPHRAFGTHPHRDMEICTYVVDGELTHKDSQGNEETLGRGSVQFMSAGRGITHSEGNPKGDKPLRFIQSWIVPRKYGLPPNYGSVDGATCDRKDKWTRIIADVDDPTAKAVGCRIQQDVNGWATETTTPLEFTIDEGRQAYLLCVEGGVAIDGGGSIKKSLARHDAAELYGPLKLTFTPENAEATHLLMFEMQAAPGSSGRRDAQE